MLDRDRQQALETTLVKLGYPSDTICQPVHEGYSGAALYRLTLPENEVLLKLATPTLDNIPLNRAHREIAFYRDLAARLPLRVPHVLAIYEDADLVTFSMSSYRSSPPSVQWTTEAYLEIARQLGSFHAAFWAKTDQLAHLTWLGWHQRQDVSADIRQAHIYWQTLREQPHFAAIFSQSNEALLQRLLARTDTLLDQLNVLPLTVCHGDCITHNILRDSDGQLVWADWQEVRLARGPEDLSFFFQRAEAEGATIPREAMITAYHASLQEHTGRAIALADIRHVMNVSELWVRLLYWPAYLMQASASALDDMLQRIRMLAYPLDI